MAGTQDRAEGRSALRVTTIDPGSNPADSLKGINIGVVPQGSTAWVTDTNNEYRWDDSSNAVPDDNNVVLPTGVTGSGRWLKILFGGGGSDPNAIHVNAANEISGIAAKGAPTDSDILVIEDAADGNNKKKISLGDLPGGVDPTAIHDNVAGEINAIASKLTPTASDELLIEDAADANNKKKITLGNLPGGVDPTAIHDNVAGEINAIALKADPTTSDELLIEDAADANNKKKITLGSLTQASVVWRPTAGATPPLGVYVTFTEALAAAVAYPGPTTIILDDAPGTAFSLTGSTVYDGQNKVGLLTHKGHTIDRPLGAELLNFLFAIGVGDPLKVSHASGNAAAESVFNVTRVQVNGAGMFLRNIEFLRIAGSPPIPVAFATTEAAAVARKAYFEHVTADSQYTMIVTSDGALDVFIAGSGSFANGFNANETGGHSEDLNIILKDGVLATISAASWASGGTVTLIRLAAIDNLDLNLSRGIQVKPAEVASLQDSAGKNLVTWEDADGGTFEIVNGTEKFITARNTGLRVAYGTQSSTLVISAGAITVTSTWHKVDTEGGAPADDLVTINGGVVGQILTLESATLTRVITLKSTGNINLQVGDLDLESTNKLVTFIFDGADWTPLDASYQIFHNGYVMQGRDSGGTARDMLGISADDKVVLGSTAIRTILIGSVVELYNTLRNRTGTTVGLRDSGGAVYFQWDDLGVLLAFGNPLELTIAAGSITVTHSRHYVDTEANSPSDDLVTITGGWEGQIIYFMAENAARTVTVKETGNILTGVGDVVLDLIHPIPFINRAGVWAMVNPHDPTAIHDNVAGEINAITLKAAPTTSDELLIEDAADANNKKKITLGSLTQVSVVWRPTAGATPPLGVYVTFADALAAAVAFPGPTTIILDDAAGTTFSLTASTVYDGENKVGLLTYKGHTIDRPLGAELLNFLFAIGVGDPLRVSHAAGNASSESVFNVTRNQAEGAEMFLRNMEFERIAGSPPIPVSLVTSEAAAVVRKAHFEHVSASSFYSLIVEADGALDVIIAGSGSFANGFNANESNAHTEDLNIILKDGVLAAITATSWNNGGTVTLIRQAAIDNLDLNLSRGIRNKAAQVASLQNSTGKELVTWKDDDGGTVEIVNGTKKYITAKDTGLRLAYGADPPLTIAAGAITVTQSVHAIDTEGAASTDDLLTINGGVEGQILWMRPVTFARVTTLKSGGNIILNASEIVLDSSAAYRALYFNGANWVPLDASYLVFSNGYAMQARDSSGTSRAILQIATSDDVIVGSDNVRGQIRGASTVTVRVDSATRAEFRAAELRMHVPLRNPTGSSSAIEDSGGATYFLWNDTGAVLAFGNPAELTISAGAVTVTHSRQDIDTEADAPNDTLATINGGFEGQIVYLTSENAARKVTIAETGNIITGVGLVILDPDHSIPFIKRGSNWAMQSPNAQALDGPGTILEISSGSITPTGNYHLVETEGGASTDDLTDITGTWIGQVLRLSSVSGEVITIQETGNIVTGGPLQLSAEHPLVLVYNGTDWEFPNAAVRSVMGSSTELTIAAGAVTATRAVHTIDTEADASSDDLDTIYGGVNGQLIYITAENSTRAVNVIESGNIKTGVEGLDLRVNQPSVFMYDGTDWGLLDPHALRATIGSDLTISAGSISITSYFHKVDTEGGAGTDDLTDIATTRIPNGQILFLKPVSSSRTVVLKDNTGNLRLAGDFSLTSTHDMVMLIKNGTSWFEVSRSDNGA